MNQLDAETTQDLIDDERYFAFLDVLGYGDLLFGGAHAPDTQRVQRLFEVWECLFVAIKESCDRFANVEPVLFSDSLYISSIDPIALIGCVAHVYTGVCTYYAGSRSDWMPWIRAGVSSGWAVDVHDPTLQQLVKDPKVAFRNPAGPGPAKAYHLAEGSGLKGARCRVTEFVKTQVIMGRLGVAPDDLERRVVVDALCGSPWPSLGPVALPDGTTCETFELPWWRMYPTGATGAKGVVQAHAWQAGGAASPAAVQLKATLDALDQAVTRGE